MPSTWRSRLCRPSCNAFGQHLDSHPAQLNGVECAFKGHVADGFTDVEKELKHINKVIGCMHGTSGKMTEMGATTCTFASGSSSLPWGPPT